MSFNGVIAPGANTSFGFQGTYSGSNATDTHLHRELRWANVCCSQH